jgi:elongation factor Ts
VPAEALERESQIARARALEEGKPESVLDRIVTGRLEKYKAEACLLRQPYIRDENVTIEKLLAQHIGSIGENIVIPALCPLGSWRKHRQVRWFGLSQKIGTAFF